MSLSIVQRLLFAMGMFLIGLNALFPPRRSEMIGPVDRACVLSDAFDKYSSQNMNNGATYTVSIDVEPLLTEEAIILAFTLGGVVLCAPLPQRKDTE